MSTFKAPEEKAAVLKSRMESQRALGAQIDRALAAAP